MVTQLKMKSKKTY